MGSVSISEVALGELHEPVNHPFRVSIDDAMTALVESVRQYGVRNQNHAPLPQILPVRILAEADRSRHHRPPAVMAAAASDVIKAKRRAVIGTAPRFALP